MKKILEKTIVNLLFIVILFFPLSLNVILISPNDLIHPIITLRISLADLLIGITLVLWIFKIILYNELKQTKLPPKPVIVFVGVGILSCINAFSMIEWVKELIMFIEYLLIFYILLLNNLGNIKISIIVDLLLILTSIVLLIAFVQSILLNGSSYLVRGPFASRNILGSYLCMTMPFVYSNFIYSNNIYRKIWMGILIASSILLILSGNALFTIIISLLILSLIHSKKVGYNYAISILLLAIIYVFIMPKKNINSIKDFTIIYEQEKINESYNRILTILYDLKKDTVYQTKINENKLVFTNDLFMSSILPEIREGSKYIDMDGEEHIKNRYLEMQAAINMMVPNSLTGVGLGNFQNFIGAYYKELPKVNTAEPNQHNGYLIISSTTGILGLTALLWLFIYSITTVYKKFRVNEAHDQVINLGLLGALIACLIENLFSNLFVASLLVPLMLIFYLSMRELSKN